MAPTTSDAELLARAETALLASSTRRSRSDKLTAARNGLLVAQRNADEQPKRVWTARELERARRRLEALLAERDE